MVETEVLRRIFGSKKKDVIRDWRNYITRSFIIRTPHIITEEIKSRV
jgi:hypothetical protein